MAHSSPRNIVLKMVTVKAFQSAVHGWYIIKVPGTIGGYFRMGEPEKLLHSAPSFFTTRNEAELAAINAGYTVQGGAVHGE